MFKRAELEADESVIKLIVSKLQQGDQVRILNFGVVDCETQEDRPRFYRLRLVQPLVKFWVNRYGGRLEMADGVAAKHRFQQRNYIAKDAEYIAKGLGAPVEIWVGKRIVAVVGPKPKNPPKFKVGDRVRRSQEYVVSEVHLNGLVTLEGFDKTHHETELVLVGE